MLRVGPQSAGADPGPACYQRGGTKATVTDAALVLGYIDPGNFLGGAMALDPDAARVAIQEQIALPLELSTEDAAAAIMEVATENMVHAIEDITVNQGIDPSKAVLIGGGGAAGLNSVLIGRRLRCDTVLIPETGAVLSAAGALMSDLSAHHTSVGLMSTDHFDYDAANEILSALTEKCNKFAENAGDTVLDYAITYAIEGHYPSQVWDIGAPLSSGVLTGSQELHNLIESFHETHEQLFAYADRNSGIEIVSWQATVRCRIRGDTGGRIQARNVRKKLANNRRCYFVGTGHVDADVVAFDEVCEGQAVTGPAIIESDLTTVVLNPGAVARKTDSGSLAIDLTGMV
jgi:N-methylhydantoinase A